MISQHAFIIIMIMSSDSLLWSNQLKYYFLTNIQWRRWFKVHQITWEIYSYKVWISSDDHLIQLLNISTCTETNVWVWPLFTERCIIFHDIIIKFTTDFILWTNKTLEENFPQILFAISRVMVTQNIFAKNWLCDLDLWPLKVNMLYDLWPGHL